MYKIFNGDCLEELKNIPPQSIDLVLTDLPYGITDAPWDVKINLAEMWNQLKVVSKKETAFLFFSAQPFTTDLINSNRKMFRYVWYWKKNIKTGFLNARKQPLRCMEEILVFYSPPPRFYPQGLREEHVPCRRGHTGALYHCCKKKYSQDATNYPTHFIEMPSVYNVHRLHPSQKPIALLEYLIKSYTLEGETVLDICMGSGTSGAAALNTGRNYFGIEKDKHFYEIAKKVIETRKENKNEIDFDTCGSTIIDA